METSAVLTANRHGIVDLTGLEYCANLEQLSLGWNQISDISPLAGLDNLLFLVLSVNQISDISPVAGMSTNLRSLYLSVNQISDISPVAGLTRLAELALDANQISDISSLVGLSTDTSLLYLYLQGNQISDISAVSGLTSLVHLELTSNQISDISSVAGLTNLGTLYLDDNQISDVSPLTGLATNLQSLVLSSNPISDISPLTGLTNLANLYCYYTYVSDLQSLVDNPGISWGDDIRIPYNPFNSNVFNIQIPLLQSRSVSVIFTPYSGTAQLIDQDPTGTWNYQLNHNSGDIYGWEYNGSSITGASVDGAAQAAGWQVITRTSTRVLFATSSPLRSGSITGFHIAGLNSGTGTYDVGTNKSSIDGPLPVQLSTFAAASTPDGIVLKWRTQSEVNNLGFHVHRSDAINGKYTRVSKGIIKGHGTDSTSHDYVFLDETAKSGETYWYAIEDVALDGTTQRSQAIRVQFTRPLQAAGKRVTLWGLLKR